MNDRHPSGDSNPADSSQDFSYAPYSANYEQSPYGMYDQQGTQNGYATAYDGSSTGAYDNFAGTYGGGDALFGAMHGSGADTGVYDTGTYGSYGTYGYDTGVHDTGTWTSPGPLGTGIPAQPGPETADYGYAAPQPAWDAGTFDTGTYDTGAYDSASFAGDTPFVGNAYDTGTYDAGNYGTGQFQPGAFDSAAYDTGTYGTGAYDTAAFNSGTYETGTYETGTFETGAYATGTHDASQWQTGQDWNAAGWETGQWDSGRWDPGPAHDHAQGAPQGHGLAHETYEPGAATAWDTDAYEHPPYEAGGYTEHPYTDPAFAPFGAEEGLGATTAMPAVDIGAGNPMAPPSPPASPFDHDFDELYAAHQDRPDSGRYDHGFADDEPGFGAFGDPGADEPGHGPSALAASGTGTGAPHSRGRRRSKPKRSALLTVAVPSVAVLGVTGVATASVMGSSPEPEETTPQAASSPDAAPVKPSKANKKLDSQLAGLSADADDFADRANRTQERIDLQKRQAEERKRKAAEAARKEAMRPKFALPVEQKGLSAQFGSAGVNWLSVHSGIDFPVDEGTPVKAATDGTITTKSDISFGNMAIVTAKDGTETWYCHLSSTKIRSGEIKAGDTFGYSGTSGNSTGPHLHFEVHPGGGDAVDPLPWLRDKGLNPL